MPVSLGMPSAPPPVLAPRRTTRQIQVGSVGVGSQHPVSVQSMTTTKTHDIGATLQQIAELTAAGCDIVRVACPTDKDAEALKVIAQQSTIPVIADIHFQPKYVFAAIEAGCGAVRVNPGNIKKFDDKVKEIAQAATEIAGHDGLVWAPLFQGAELPGAAAAGRFAWEYLERIHSTIGAGANEVHRDAIAATVLRGRR